MGNVRMGPPHNLLVEVCGEFGIDVFIETGTWTGNTAEWASKTFSRVVTIELADEVFEQAKEGYGTVENIGLIHGSSAEKLPEVTELSLTHNSILEGNFNQIRHEKKKSIKFLSVSAQD